MAKTSVAFGIIILCLAAAYFGFQIYNDKPQTKEENIQTPSPEPNPTTPSVRNLQTPTPSGTLDISGCNPIPKQLQLKVGQDFQVKNSDSVTHIIIIDPTHQYKITAGSSTTISLESFGVIGTIGYRCDNASSETFTGTFHISE